MSLYRNTLKWITVTAVQDMNIRYLTFDCYGTLIDWKKGIEDNFKTFARFDNPEKVDIFKNYVTIESKAEHGYSPYRRILATTFLDLADQLNLHPSEEESYGFADSITHWPAFEDTSSTLRSLGKRGYKRVILSNIDKGLLQETINNGDLEVDGFITAEEVKSYKPEHGHWLELLKLYKVSKEEVIHVAGSIYHDIIPVSKLGFRTVWVNRYNESEPTEVRPTYLVSSLSEILNIL